MKYMCTLIAVSDIEKSKQFYCGVLGLRVEADLGANVTLTGGIALQTLDTWASFIQRPPSEIRFGSNAGELYFEEDNIDSFCAQLPDNIQYVHRLHEHPWGQRVVRFYDPDAHIIEVGENMAIVVKRFVDSGLTAQETADRMDVSVEYVEFLLSGDNNEPLGDS